MRRSYRVGIVLFVGGLLAAGAYLGRPLLEKRVATSRQLPPSSRIVNTRVAINDPIVRKIIAAAHAQEGDFYNAAYRTISYPGGDVRKGSGACTDVVVRSLRGAGYDLQKLVHEDMAKNFALYPKLWGLKKPNTSIDHRRVPNLMTFFERKGQSLPLGTTGADLKTWKPGDIVCWQMPNNKWHTGVVSDGIGESGKPMVIHNGWMCIEQDYLDGFPIIGHYRFPKREI